MNINIAQLIWPKSLVTSVASDQPKVFWDTNSNKQICILSSKTQTLPYLSHGY